MRVYITGASGFIGRALAAHYRAAGADVRGMDRAADPGAGVVAGDVAVPGPWQDHAAGSDLVIHTAATVSMRLDRADAMWRVNVLGTRHALEAAERAGAARFLHFSSVVVFGAGFPDGVDERRPVHPEGLPYGDSKIAAEQHVLQAHAEGRIPVTVVRPGDVYGPGARAWALVPADLIRRGRFLLPDGGRGVFSPVFVDNLVDAVARLASSPEAAGQVVTVTDGIGVPNREFFAPVAAVVGKPLRTAPAPVAFVAARIAQAAGRLEPGDTDVNPMAVRYMLRRGTYSIEKARRLGVAPRVGLDEGQARTVAWLREALAA